MEEANVFLAYSHVDEVWKDRVAALLGDYRLEIWDSGEDRLDLDGLERLEEAMEEADGAVLLVSESLIGSPLLREVVLPVLHQRHEKGQLRMVLVLVEACDWRGIDGFSGLAMHSLESEPLASGSQTRVEEALAALAADVRSMAVPEPLPSFEDIYREQFQSVLSYFGRLGVPVEECRDLTQETFANAYKGIGGFRREARVKTWLHKIARHVWLNRCRDLAAMKRRSIEVSIHGSENDGGSMDFPGVCLNQEDRVLVAERLARTRKALARLPPQRRRCAYLRSQGYKYREIAALMGISIQGVRSHLYQAREQLREFLGEDLDDSF